MPQASYPQSDKKPNDFAVRMENIGKRFPGVVANHEVCLRVPQGTFHAVIGENGAGKSTLLNILYGRLRPDVGRIFLFEEEVTQRLHTPADALRCGVAMVSQHYSLISALSVLENVLLGVEPTTLGGLLRKRKAAERVQELAQRLGLENLDLNARADSLSVAAQQKVEILKALYRGARILLLDEPTATLAPQEADSLFVLLRNLVEEGTTILFVTHKLREVREHSHAVTVLRGGRNAGDFVTAQTSEAELLIRMMGARANTLATTGTDLTGTPASLQTSPPSPIPQSPVFQIEIVTVRNTRRAVRVNSASLEVRRGEIVGVAGVDGSGQKELAEAILGLQRLDTGKMFLGGEEITRLSVAERRKRGVAYIPEDRHRVGLALDFTLAENYLLGRHRDPEWGGGILLQPQKIAARASAMIQNYRVRVGEQGAQQTARTLSGGNQQKVVVARAMDSVPRLLVACQPTRGLDVDAAQFVYQTLKAARSEGMGILLFSLDLEEIFEVSDRIAVMFNGRIVAVLPREEATEALVGAYMTGSQGGASEVLAS